MFRSFHFVAFARPAFWSFLVRTRGRFFIQSKYNIQFWSEKGKDQTLNKAPKSCDCDYLPVHVLLCNVPNSCHGQASQNSAENWQKRFCMNARKYQGCKCVRRLLETSSQSIAKIFAGHQRRKFEELPRQQECEKSRTKASRNLEWR